ncbi:helix-turn-helix domain-containing protein [uncultured Shewanella sp.]|uniref:AlbA family DNA-binding domain-containing protein n=1 Tax=uncultured Shewanella sp. TaxID=173975 RepID=UPI00260F60D9|nr:ATP-binding protein [uncultured Shewanella sp.]
MPTEQNIDQLRALLKELCHLPDETEWVEFKHNVDVVKIGEYISALANSAALLGKQTAYLVYGVDDKTHDVVGTKFTPSTQKHKGQELESWLLQKTAPKIHFQFYEFTHTNNKHVVIVEIQAATHTPVQFDGTEYIRVGSYKKKLREFAEKERALWRVFDNTPFEQQLAA